MEKQLLDRHKAFRFVVWCEIYVNGKFERNDETRVEIIQTSSRLRAEEMLGLKPGRTIYEGSVIVAAGPEYIKQTEEGFICIYNETTFERDE